MAAIRWNPGDSAGERTLSGAGALSRFNRWQMQPASIGEEAEGVGDGIGYKWRHRTDRGASMELIVAHADMDLLHEFLEWANEFNPFAIDTEDANDTTFDACQIKVRTRAVASAPDPETLDVTLSMTVLNIDSNPQPMIQQF